MGGQQFGTQVDNSQLQGALDTTVTANTANQFDDDAQSHDIATSQFETSEQNISGATEVSGGVKVNDSGDANIKIIWKDGNDNAIFSESPAELQSITGAKSFNFIVKSTHFDLVVDGTSNDANVTVNAH